MITIPTEKERAQIRHTIPSRLLMVRQALLNLVDAIEYQPERRAVGVCDLCGGLAEVLDDIYNDFDRYTLDD